MGPSGGSVDARPRGVVRRPGFHRDAKLELQHKKWTRVLELLNPRKGGGCLLIICSSFRSSQNKIRKSTALYTILRSAEEMSLRESAKYSTVIYLT